MKLTTKTYNRPVCLKIVLETFGKEKIWIKVKDAEKPFTFYTDRYAIVEGKQTYYVKMPQSPQEAKIILYNEATGDVPKNHDDSFRLVSIERLPLETGLRNAKLSTKRFVTFAQEFAAQAGYISANNSIYTSDNGVYRIDYLDKIVSTSGKEISTPARISQKTGIIQISKKHFKGYTIPMRMAILLHEFSHFYVNSVKSDEVEADINGLKIYLELNYPKIDAYNVFLHVFQNAPSAQNKERYQILDAFIRNYGKSKVR